MTLKEMQRLQPGETVKRRPGRTYATGTVFHVVEVQEKTVLAECRTAPCPEGYVVPYARHTFGYREIVRA
jgi:hypothetical protein